MSLTTDKRTISTDVQPLTKENIKAMKEATSVAFFHNPFARDNDEQRMAGMIALTKRVKAQGGWQTERETELRMEIPVASRITYWGHWCSDNPSGASKDTHLAAVTCDTMAQSSPIWQTIVRSLKAGDRLTLEWEADIYGQDSPLRKAGMTMDRLKLTVVRDNKVSLAFLLDTYAGESNSLARFIRRDLW